MRRTRAAAAAALAGLGLVVSGCAAIDLVIWGPDGAAVIRTTERFVDAASAGDGASFVCDGHDPDLRAPADWVGMSAEEPEAFHAESWADQAPLEPSWIISLSLPDERVAPGSEHPGVVFYQETDDGLCVVDVVWSTVLG
jgi:hypothetical protein